ncbi:hypothetical protein OG488_27775 [Streptomyces sp. NBC_01460]|uniref:DUF6571 family protein n=1 Tax=Streptomyces sp. NBC_01460 TaxID=2903875 RepID=UPI002E330591|nr:DUF6571 family protein [Streptomyces sp. NBC_01460]
MDLETLRFATFGQLDAAVTDWSAMVTNLATLKEDARDGLKAKADKADWSGENATVTKGFVDRTVREFDDAHKQAKSLWSILKDTRDELKTYQGQLDDALGRGLKKNLTVTTTGGGGFTVTMNIHPDRAAKGTAVPDHEQNDVTALRDELQRILDKATESDHTGSGALKALADQAALGFTGAEYKDRDTAANAIKQADDLSALAKKNPEDLTAKEFDKLNTGLKKMSGDELFSSRFAGNLGAQGTLDFWAGLNTPRPTDLQSARGGQFDDLQKNLSLTLATASHSDSYEMRNWKREMVDLGNQPISRNSGTVGFQVMSNLMRWGNYDNKFLDDYGNELIKAEKERTDNGRHEAWRVGAPMDPILNRTGSDSGTDPLTGFMKALSNSPDAATEFFSDTFLTKEEDHEFKEDTDGDKKMGIRELSNFDYLFEERDWPKDYTDKGEDSISGRNAMALALEAAITGHPAGEIPSAGLSAHSESQAKLMESLTASISEDPGRLTDHGYMSDSIGQIASEYLPDINRATTDASEDNTSVPKLFPIAGSAANLGHTDVTRLLVSLGQNPEGYSAVEVGQKSYMASLMDYHLNPNLADDQKYPHSTEDTVKEISRRSGEVGGTLAIGRQEAVLGEAKEDDDNFENAVNQKKGIASGVIGTGVGIGTSFVASPVVGAAVGGVAGTVSGAVLEQLFKDTEPEKVKSSGQTVGELWEDNSRRNTELAKTAAESAGNVHNSRNIGQFMEWTRVGTKDGFGDASTAAQQMADDLETDIPT